MAKKKLVVEKETRGLRVMTRNRSGGLPELQRPPEDHPAVSFQQLAQLHVGCPNAVRDDVNVVLFEQFFPLVGVVDRREGVDRTSWTGEAPDTAEQAHHMG